MKLRTIVKIAVISSVVLLCTGFAMFSFSDYQRLRGVKTLIFIRLFRARPLWFSKRMILPG